MPVYEYGCEAGHRFEVKQKFSDSPLTTCQVCLLPVTKLISAPGISFKGSGWYVTDYSNKFKDPTTQEKSPASAAPKEAGSAGETKPAPPASTPSSDSSATKTGSSSSSNGGSSAGAGPSSPTPSGS